MRQLKTLLTVVGGATILVLAGNTIALATTGHSLILGQGNSANNVTGISRTTTGSALKLTTKSSSSAPLTVNGRGKVTNLNADTVDGLDSAVLANRTSVYTGSVNVMAVNSFTFHTPAKSAGTYLVSVSGWIDGPTTGDSGYLNCYVKANNHLIEQYLPVNADGAYTLDINGTIALPSTQAIEFTCGGPTGNYKSFAADLIRVSVTKVGIATTAALTTN